MGIKGKPVTFNGVAYRTQAEAAKALGCSETTIRNYINRGITELEPRAEKRVQKRQKIVVDGTEYKSIHDAEIKIYGRFTGRLYNRVLNGETELTARPLKIKSNAIEVVDSCGNKYRSIGEMERAIGVSQGTVSKRLKNGTLNAPHKLPSNANINGKRKCHYWYDGVEYDSLKSALKWLHHGVAWIKSHCVETCEYINRDTGLDEYKADTYSVILALYQHQVWNEDRVIAECDRRMKKLFAHGKLIKAQVT